MLPLSPNPALIGASGLFLYGLYQGGRSVQQGLQTMQQTKRKRRNLLRHVQELGPELAKAWGKQTSYSPTKIQQTAKSLGYDYATDDFCYALALYTDENRFDSYHSDRGETCDYFKMRQEAGHLLGNYIDFGHHFDASHVIDQGEQLLTHGPHHHNHSSSHSSSHHSGHDSGHHSGHHHFGGHDFGGHDFGGHDFGGHH